MATQRLNCAQCDAPLPVRTGRGRPQRFCSEACKKAAMRKRQNSKRPVQGQRHCRHCGETFEGKTPYCSDRCYYYANKDALPRANAHLRAYDETLFPFVPRSQINAFDLNRSAWHAQAYGGKKEGS